MPENTAAATTAASKKAAQAAVVASETVLPTVVETAELALEVPAKVVLNQRLVVAASIVGGAALGAGILFGVQKFLAARNKGVVVVDPADEKNEPTIPVV